MASDTAQANAIIEAGRSLGFAQVGFAKAQALPQAAAALSDWLAAGYHGEMAFMEKNQPRDVPQRVLPQAETVIVVVYHYGRDAPLAPAATSSSPFSGQIARYAQGVDYHVLLKEKLYALAARCQEIFGPNVPVRPCVDTAPLLERAYCAEAGVGFIGKSCMLIVPGTGTYTLLGELVIGAQFALPPPPLPPNKVGCGRCTLCLTACPTQAFTGPYTLDARRCVAYLTIEHRGPIPYALRPKMGNMIFGCDICQQVCPYNGGSQPRRGEEDFADNPHLQHPDLRQWMNLGSSAYKRLIANTALRRAPHRQMLRNVLVALGNSRQAGALPALRAALRKHGSQPLLRDHALWALGRIGGPAALAALLPWQQSLFSKAGCQWLLAVCGAAGKKSAGR